MALGLKKAGRRLVGALCAAAAALAAWPAAADRGDGLDLIPEAVNRGAAWKIVKPAWDEADEDGYEAFVRALGYADCATLADCLRHPANPYRDTDKRVYHGDCADMAYILRGYYAWKNGLPFSYQSQMRTADGSREDLRYSSSGNVVAARRSAVATTPISGPAFLSRIGGEVSTAMFRTHPDNGDGRKFDDFYPIEISRRKVRPGVIAYDIFGHVGIVYDVLEDGRVLIVASHPDNTISRTSYGPNFLRSKPALGAGLKGWRPIYVDGAERRSDGVLLGGTVRAVSNSGIEGFSVEQYIGNAPHPTGAWNYAQFKYDGRTLNYFDYVRRKLAAPGFAYNPVTELRYAMRSLCGDVKARRAAVSRATRARFHLTPHPPRLPPNIYGTYGPWETYSTPSRDARLKVGFIELRRMMQDLYERASAGAPGVVYTGGDLEGDLLQAYEDEVAACKIIYRRSDDSRVRLSLEDVMNRLWDLSFDPYHCPERRWGARGLELETCTDDEVKTRWYNAQRFLRNQAARTYDTPMGFSLDELKPPMQAAPQDGGLGVEFPADADVAAYLRALQRPVDPSGLSAPDSLTTADAGGASRAALASGPVQSALGAADGAPSGPAPANGAARDPAGLLRALRAAREGVRSGPN
ncbi:MAG: hypothetical protein AAGC56_03635 [Pseudomonadota bacterium]